jgi:hypothetical protein
VFLGFDVLGTGIEVDESKVKVIKDWLAPTNERTNMEASKRAAYIKKYMRRPMKQLSSK